MALPGNNIKMANSMYQSVIFKKGDENENLDVGKRQHQQQQKQYLRGFMW